jgi:hypothetical protein
MKKIFGAKKHQGPPPSIQDATERVSTLLCSYTPTVRCYCIDSWAAGDLDCPISTSSGSASNADGLIRLHSMRVAGCQVNKRGETVDEKIKKLDEELARYKDQIRKTRPGPSQEAIKARAIRLLKHKRMYLNSLSSPILSSPLHFCYTHFHSISVTLTSTSVSCPFDCLHSPPIQCGT